MRIRKALESIARELDTDKIDIDDLEKELHEVSDKARWLLEYYEAQIPRRASDLFAEDKKFDQLAKHALSMTRILDQIGVPGRNVLYSAFSGFARMSRPHPSWPEWKINGLGEFDEHCRNWLAPFLDLARDDSGNRINPYIAAADFGQLKRELIDEVVDDTRIVLQTYSPGLPTLDQIETVARAVLETTSPGLSRGLGVAMGRAWDGRLNGF